MDIADFQQRQGTWRDQWAARLPAVPVPLYGGALALLGLCLLVPAVWPVTRQWPVMSWLFGAGLLALLGALATHGAKAMLATPAFMRDLRNAATAPFFGQIGVALALLAETQHGERAGVAEAALLGSAVLAAVSLAQALWLVLRQRPTWRDASPAWLLPSIQWLYLGVLAGESLAWLRTPALVLGCLGAMIAGLCLAARLWNGPALPQPARPALTTTLVVPSLLLLAALQEATPSDALVAASFVLTLAGYLMAVARMPLALGEPFRVSWWAYGMPLSAAAIAFHALALRQSTSPWLLSWAQLTAGLSVGITMCLSLLALRAVHRFIFNPSAHP